MGQAPIDQTLSDLLDRDAIRILQQRYFRGVDHHDLAMITACYWPDAEGDFKAWQGRMVDQLVRAADAEVGTMNFADLNHGAPDPEDLSRHIFGR